MITLKLYFLIILFVNVYANWELTSKEDSDSREHGQVAGSRSTSCPCGWTNKARIAGGKETLINEYPLIAGLIDSRGTLFCGGTIISQVHILTAAHCTQPYKMHNFRVAVGEHDLYKETETNATEIINVAYTIEHEEYHPGYYSNDIAIVVLKRKIIFNHFIGPACMPTRRRDFLDQHVKVLGWGKTRTNGILSRRLMKVNLRVVPISACTTRFPYQFETGAEVKQICTYRQNRDSCQGDSGGPLLWLDPGINRYTVVALVSYGKECGGKDPTINTEVAAYMPWIESKIKISASGIGLCKRIG